MKPNSHLKYARQQRGWSQARVAEAIGASPMSIKRWEHGLTRPSPYYREQLCLLFECTVQQLGLQEYRSGVVNMSKLRRHAIKHCAKPKRDNSRSRCVRCYSI